MDTNLLEKLEYTTLEDGGIEITKLTDKGVSEVLLPEGVVAIGKRAFGSSIKLKKVTLPSTLKRIGEYAFAGCINLKEINFPQGLEEIGNGAFSLTSDIAVINLPSSVREIGTFAFSGSSGITAINVDPENTAFRSEDGILYSADGKTLIQCPPKKKGDITVLEITAEIGMGAFVRSEMSSIHIGAGVTYISRGAFEKADALTSITVSEDNKRYFSRNNTLYSGDGKTLIKYAASSPEEEMVIADGVTHICSWAFAYCKNLKRVFAPNSLEVIEREAFFNATSLEYIDVGRSLTEIGYSAFSYCANLRFPELPNTFLTLGENSFFACSSITEVTLPESITKIGNRPFNGCPKIAKLTYDGTRAKWEEILDTVTGIPEEAELVLLREPEPVEEEQAEEAPVEEKPVEEKPAPVKKDLTDEEAAALFNELFADEDKPKDEAKDEAHVEEKSYDNLDPALLDDLINAKSEEKTDEEAAEKASEKKKGFFARLFKK